MKRDKKDFIKGLIIANIFYGLFFLTGVLISDMPWEILGISWIVTNAILAYFFRDVWGKHV